MLIETIFKHFFNLEHKRNVIALGMFVTLIGVVVGTLLFPDDHLPAVFFSVMPLLPFVNRIFHRKMEKRTVAELYAFLFVGMMIVFAFYFAFLSRTFDVSIYRTLGAVNPFELFSSVLSNNVKLIIVVFLLSMIYNIGSLFILALNAALISQLFSSFVIFQRLDLFLFFLPHTIIEFTSFFLAAIAGALLTIAFTSYKRRNAEFDQRILQAAVFFTLSVIAVMVAAVVESFAMPALVATYSPAFV